MSWAHHAIASAFLFGLGAAVGSFLNVCAHRIPMGLSVLRPASRCPGCGSPIAPRDNVPVLGWLLLRGRCRSCSAPISPRYPIVEAAVGLLLVRAYRAAGPDPLELGPARCGWLLLDGLALAGFAVTGALIALDRRPIPPSIGSAGIVAALLLAAGRPDAPPLPGLLDALLGLLASGGVALACSRLARARPTPTDPRAGPTSSSAPLVGAGEVAFATMIGAFVGIRWVVPVAASATLLAVGLALSPSGRLRRPPGLALGLSALLPILCGPWLGPH